MPDKKLNNNDIIKALDICSKSTNGCSHSKYTCEDCYLNGQPMCSSVLLQDAIDLHARQQAEIERLNKEVETFADIGKMYSEIKAEAYREFAVRLLALIGSVELPNLELRQHINNLLNELVGEDE